MEKQNEKRCMPIVNGDLCPISIDVIESHQDDVYDSPLHYVDHKEHNFDDEENEIYDEEDYWSVEDAYHTPIIEKGEFHQYGVEEYENADHMIPEKNEHHTEPADVKDTRFYQHYTGMEDVKEVEQVQEELLKFGSPIHHIIPQKSEHYEADNIALEDENDYQSSREWTAEFHGV